MLTSRGIVAPLLAVIGVFSSTAFGDDSAPNAAKPQYQAGGITVPSASADEPLRKTFALAPALDYAEQGAEAWSKTHRCVTCHTNGTYMLIRPALTAEAGKPSESMRSFFVRELKELRNPDRDPQEIRQDVQPTIAAYIAAGLAEWDAHITKTLSPETVDAIELMFDVQSEDGSWGNQDCWPPFESDVFHGATIAGIAIGTAPGWLEHLSQDAPQQAKVARLKQYLQTTTPPHDYGRVMLLWANSRLPGLLDDVRKQEIIAMIGKHQREDGGWSLRAFSQPEAWGSGNRAEKLKSEPEYRDPPSDGHQTGLAVIVLREAGVPADDPRIQRAVRWLLTHQQESGRWWTRSLNNDNHHFITYSGTLYPLLALSKCNSLAPSTGETP